MAKNEPILKSRHANENDDGTIACINEPGDLVHLACRGHRGDLVFSIPVTLHHCYEENGESFVVVNLPQGRQAIARPKDLYWSEDRIPSWSQRNS